MNYQTFDKSSVAYSILLLEAQKLLFGEGFEDGLDGGSDDDDEDSDVHSDDEFGIGYSEGDESMPGGPGATLKERRKSNKNFLKEQ